MSLFHSRARWLLLCLAVPIGAATTIPDTEAAFFQWMEAHNFYVRYSNPPWPLLFALPNTLSSNANTVLSASLNIAASPAGGRGLFTR